LAFAANAWLKYKNNCIKWIFSGKEYDKPSHTSDDEFCEKLMSHERVTVEAVA
jgi:hypothetical protein